MASAAGVPEYSPSRPQRRITQYPPLLLGKHPRKDAFLATYGQTFVMLAAPPGAARVWGSSFRTCSATRIRS